MPKRIKYLIYRLLISSLYRNSILMPFHNSRNMNIYQSFHWSPRCLSITSRVYQVMFLFASISGAYEKCRNWKKENKRYKKDLRGLTTAFKKAQFSGYDFSFCICLNQLSCLTLGNRSFNSQGRRTVLIMFQRYLLDIEVWIKTSKTKIRSHKAMEIYYFECYVLSLNGYLNTQYY